MMTSSSIGQLGLLLLSLAASSSAAALPPSSQILQPRTSCGGPNEPPCTSCQDISFQSSKWTVKALSFNSSVIFSTPAHQIDGASVSFNLTNDALDYPMVCKGFSSQAGVPFAQGESFTCTPGNETALDYSNGSHHGNAKATFVWDWPSKTLNISETWQCYDNFPTTFSATGNAAANLTCTETQYQNPNWTIGDTYSSDITTCAPIDLVVPMLTKQAVG